MQSEEPKWHPRPCTPGDLRRPRRAGGCRRFLLTESDYAPGLETQAHAHSITSLVFGLRAAWSRSTAPARASWSRARSSSCPRDVMHSDQVGTMGCSCLFVTLDPDKLEAIQRYTPILDSSPLRLRRPHRSDRQGALPRVVDRGLGSRSGRRRPGVRPPREPGARPGAPEMSECALAGVASRPAGSGVHPPACPRRAGRRSGSPSGLPGTGLCPGPTASASAVSFAPGGSNGRWTGWKFAGPGRRHRGGRGLLRPESLYPLFQAHRGNDPGALSPKPGPHHG